MAVKSKDIKGLPGSKSKFWKHADVNLHELKSKKPHKHKFKRISGTEYECACGAGLIATKSLMVDI
jgi:hypothetical protein